MEKEGVDATNFRLEFVQQLEACDLISPLHSEPFRGKTSDW